jgi:hypothetical protein
LPVSDYDRHFGKRLRRTFVRDSGFFPAEPGPETELRGETNVNARKILATAALCTLLMGAGFAQVTGQTIQERKDDALPRAFGVDR